MKIPFDCYEKYSELVRTQPTLFDNPTGEVYQIQLDPDLVCRAQEEAQQLRIRNNMPSDDVRVGVLAHDPYL